jgi:ABC-type glycerol-3-phosphate transport system substrate-binding protein
MTEDQKRIGIIVLAVLAVVVAVYSAVTFMGGEREQVVGTLPMPAGGGRDAEKGTTGTGGSGGTTASPDPSGMPPGMAEPLG